MKWLVGGYYGLGNIGDELMCRCLVDWITEIDSGAEISVLMARGGNIRYTSLPARVSAQVLPGGGVFSFQKILEGIDRFVVGGGTCFHRFGVAGLYQNITGRALGADIAWIGIGADELGSVKNNIKGRMSLACAHAVSVRDRESAEQIRRIRGGVAPPVYPDLVFTLGDTDSWEESDKVTPNGRELLVAWRNMYPYLGRADQSRLDEKLSQLLVRLVDDCKLDQIVILNSADAVDDQACERLSDALRKVTRNLEVRYDGVISLAEKMTWLKRSGAVVSARLHPLMLATFAARPSFGLAYASKLNRFASLLERSPVATIDDALAAPDAVADHARDVLLNPPGFRQPLAELTVAARGHRSLLARSAGQVI